MVSAQGSDELYGDERHHIERVLRSLDSRDQQAQDRSTWDLCPGFQTRMRPLPHMTVSPPGL